MRGEILQVGHKTKLVSMLYDLIVAGNMLMGNHRLLRKRKYGGRRQGRKKVT